MSTRVGERVDDWTERPFSGGYRELQKLADSAFSGVVRAGGAELFMTRGTVVGIRRGSIDDFEDGSGTVYEAPTDALPLLAIMQERSDEVRAKYYSEDTSISEVDNTLESGGFTGFIELSENVLSGDYYLVYHQGHSMAVAYVGNSQQLLTEDEAFERANDEVGIYEVRPVDIEPIEIPDPPEPEPDPEPESDPEPAAGAAIDDSEPAELSADAPEPTETAETVVDPSTDHPAEGAESQDATDSKAAPESEPTAGSEATSEVPEPAKTATADTTDETDDVSAPDQSDEESPPAESPKPDPTDTSQTETPTPERTEREPSPKRTTESDASAAESASQDTTAESDQPATGDETDREGTARQVAATQTEPASSNPAEDDVPPTPTPTAGGETPASSTIDEGSGTRDDPGSLETRAIPSLDPERTSSRNGGGSGGPRRDAPGRTDESPPSAGTTSAQSTERRDQSQNQTAQAETSQRQQSTDDDPESHEEPQADEQAADTTTPDDPPEQTGSQSASNSSTAAPDEAVTERIDELQELLAEREKEINRLESSLQTAESERESVRRELETVREERDELGEQVEKLENELHRLEEELGAATDAQQRMTPQEALTGTDIFVRYRSKGDATLEKAHQSGAVKKDVVENLRLEKHTQFDADISAVGGREYDKFLEATVAYEFVTWVVEDLIFEIQGTGHTESLSELYDALPKINRIELNGAVNVTTTEDGQETQGTESFDIVFRERMGDPLLVANINDSRQGASQAMMEDLITAAERVGRTSDQFASAFLLTESFFEPEALETVAAATRGGILSRDKRKSFVNLSRKQGYHLCLVEARNQNFHLEVPEL